MTSAAANSVSGAISSTTLLLSTRVSSSTNGMTCRISFIISLHLAIPFYIFVPCDDMVSSIVRFPYNLFCTSSCCFLFLILANFAASLLRASILLSFTGACIRASVITSASFAERVSALLPISSTTGAFTPVMEMNEEKTLFFLTYAICLPC